MSAPVDVVVIGAGVAGLACARELVRAGTEVVVLEARDRVGGRILSLRDAAGEPVELGAQVVHGDRAASWEAIRAAGLRTAPLEPAPVVFGVQGRAVPAAALARGGVSPPWALEARLVAAEPPDRPVADVLAELAATPAERAVALEWLAQGWSADPTRLSAAGVARWTRAAVAGRGEHVVRDGYDRLPAQLARGLDVRLATPARAVEWATAGVAVHADEGPLRAAAAVVAVPPPVVAGGALRFEPALPPVKARAAAALEPGPALTLAVTLSEPAPESAWALVLGEASGFWRARAGSRTLLGSLKGPAAARPLPEPAAGALVTGLAGAALPWLAPGSVAAVHVADWTSDPWARGGFPFPRVGALDAPAAWAAPAPPLFFAGDAACPDRHAARVHGALESGLRAARAALSGLRRS